MKAASASEHKFIRRERMPDHNPVFSSQEGETETMKLPNRVRKLILGGKETINKPGYAAAAAKDLIPYLQTEMILNAHHITTLAQPELFNQRMLRFLTE